jgi:predicted DNA-binding transcriptional regulator AlpA
MTAAVEAAKPLTLNAVAALTGRDRHTIMSHVRLGLFPPPLDLGVRVKRYLWDPAVVDAFLAKGPVRKRTCWDGGRRRKVTE